MKQKNFLYILGFFLFASKILAINIPLEEAIISKIAVRKNSFSNVSNQSVALVLEKKYVLIFLINDKPAVSSSLTTIKKEGDNYIFTTKSNNVYQVPIAKVQAPSTMADLRDKLSSFKVHNAQTLNLYKKLNTLWVSCSEQDLETSQALGAATALQRLE